MADLRETTEPRMARLALYFFSALTLFVAAFTLKVSVAVDSLWAIPSFTFSIVFTFLIFFMVLFRRSKATQLIVASVWLFTGIFLGYQAPISEIMTQPILSSIVLFAVLIVIFLFFYMAFSLEREIERPSTPQYRKHTGEKGFRIDVEA